MRRVPGFRRLRAGVGLASACVLFPVLAGAASVILDWDPPSSGNQTGYVVERKSGGGGYFEVWRPLAPPYTDTFTSTANTCWRVKAYNGMGYSGYSNEVCLDLPSVPLNLSIKTTGPLAGQSAIKASTAVTRPRR